MRRSITIFLYLAALFAIGYVIGIRAVRSEPRADMLIKAPSHTIESGCLMATIWRDGIVVVDWACIDKTAEQWREGKQFSGWALLFRDVKRGASPIDWDYIEGLAAQWKPGGSDPDIAFGYALKAVHDGMAQETTRLPQ